MNSRVISRKISHVSVKNFQTHVDSFFSLENGMNLIVGTSDSGKTALAKAVNFVIYNISDSEYVRYFSKQLEVEIHFEDGAIIKRIKGKDINQVSFKYPDDFDFTTYSAFGTNYPDEVLEFLGQPILSKVLGALSYSEQKNKLFLIDLSPSLQPKVISAVIGTEDIQKAADILASDVRDFNDKIKTTEVNIEQLNEKLENNYIDLDNKISKLEEIQDYLTKINEKDLQVVQLQNSLTNFNSLKKRGKEAENKKAFFASVVDLLQSEIINLESYSNKITNMNNLIVDLENKNKKYIKTKENHDKLKKIIDSELSDKLSKIQSKIKDVNNIQKLSDDLLKKTNESDKISLKISNYRQAYNDAKSDLDKAYEIITKNNWHCQNCNKFGGEIMS
jgi:DNA repair exonuclease SbcCD ATPase subunit